MIVNESVLSQEDAVFLTKCIIKQNMKTRQKKLSGMILLICGLLSLGYSALCVWVIFKSQKYQMHIPTTIYLEAVIAGAIGVVGLLGFIFGSQITLWRVTHSKEWSQVFGQTVRTVFENDSIKTTRSAVGTDTQARYAYNLIEGYTEKNGSLYIWITANQQKKFIVLRDDGYTEGSKGEVIAMLQAKGVPITQLP